MQYYITGLKNGFYKCNKVCQPKSCNAMKEKSFSILEKPY